MKANKNRNIVKEKNKKKLPADVSSSIFTFIVILVTLGVTLPFHFAYPDKLTVYWVIAICVAVISPCALTNFKIFMESKRNYSEEQKKAASLKLGKSIFSIWYADFVFICMFMNWLVAFFILAGLYLIKIVYNVSIVLLNRKDSMSYPNFFIVGDFVLSFLLLILIVYKIPNESLQTIVVALTAALIGGFLTMLGVMLTIKKSDRDKKDERMNQIRPFFYYTPYYDGPKNRENEKLVVHDKTFSNGNEKADYRMLGRFVNSNKIEFLLKSIIVNNVEFRCTFDPAVSKGELFMVHLQSDVKLEKFEEYILVIEDVDKNVLNVKITLDTSGSECVPTNIEFLN